MKIVNTGNIYRIYDDTLKTFDKLPIGVYSVRFDKMSGFFLEKHADIEIKEEKIYGVHYEKVEKVFKAFNMFNRNLGVILSGDKGIGKSLFAKLLTKKSVESNLPIILVDTYYFGIASYLSEIEQEVVVVFDEFDKTFASNDKEGNPQDELLTLLDGFEQGKKMFVITCNELRKLNDYFVNRTGRFHYHFRFEYPTPAEITEYLSDKLDSFDDCQVRKVISFSTKAKLTYDSLRAIAFEMNNGETFESCIKDLNIMNVENSNYIIELLLEDGTVLKQKTSLNMFDEDETISFRIKQGDIVVKFNGNNADVNYTTGVAEIGKNDIYTTIEYWGDDENFVQPKAVKMTIRKELQNNMRYMV